jgi:hypothetical protein
MGLSARVRQGCRLRDRLMRDLQVNLFELDGQWGLHRERDNIVSEAAKALTSGFRFIRTCCATLRAITWRMPARTRTRSGFTWATRNIRPTVRYTELAAGRFKDFWED